MALILQGVGVGDREKRVVMFVKDRGGRGSRSESERRNGDRVVVVVQV